MEILCFFAGIAFAYSKSLYAFLFLAMSLSLKPRWTLLGCFLVAIFWSVIHNRWVADSDMPSDVQVITKAILEGEIVSIPTTGFSKSQFQFLINQLNGKQVKSTVLLACYTHCPKFKVGDFWHFEAKLKKPVNLGNPGGFDYVGWLNARHISWTGYIRPHSAKLLTRVHSPQSLLGFREHLALNVGKLMPKEKVLGVFEALTLGLTNHIDKSQWDLFRRTGTTHLMVISGSHIGLVAGLSFLLMRWLWSRGGRLCLHYPADQAASIVSFLMALIYALIAGFAAASQRSLIACFFLLLKNFLNHRFTAWQAWRYSLLAVLLYEPHDVLSPGFYLSFLAVASLLLGSQRFSAKGFRKTIILQLICLFGLMPLTLFWFSYGAVNGVLANLLAIPLVEFIIVPLSLIALFMAQWWDNSLLLILVSWAIEGLLYYLNWIDALSLLNLNFSFISVLSPLALMLTMLVLLFFPVKTMWPALIVMSMAALFPGYPRVKDGKAEINIIDVGQGLAVSVRTAKHLLIYDTGVKFYQGGDMAKLAIIPYLNTLGIKKVDKVIISHPDLDHRGGLASLEENYKIDELIVNSPSFYHRGKNCHHYPAWQWDGVNFRFLAINKRFKNKNNNSCILQIENKEQKILLTGDIERLAENYLVTHYKGQLQSAVLVLPHHGSKTSSSLPFIKQVAPQFAVISAGFDNRYHFPHKETLQTLQKQRIDFLNTADCGMVTIRLSGDRGRVKPTCYKTE
ncbi:DNA internalization-related competence protein ComEC/Rec2 [Legionella cardiaca]|uniref:DNA internalization-related competence protein ComEC/Rec2 n=1 Tax=Legionella cardiaca TaxID=1071983 RepID=A0ABY8AV85_9GAMM|nr:DNA internalization-related competence protein ComEC/Rec2 [Legionella cardiaca]WED44612.1 DNA internalization-related competence protein ComEC/Rec2 [Legionella cardiaca]